MSTLVGKPAPAFDADGVVKGEFKKISLSNYKDSKYVVLFFYPLDFTFVCPTELHAFQERLADFQSRNTEVIGVSVDSKFSHLAWLNTPKAQGGIQGITYPLVSDIHKTISREYGVLFENAGIAFRGLFLIDKSGVVRHTVVNDLPLGRNVDEALRMVDALQFSEEHGEVCPANWHKGEKAMKPTTDGLRRFFG